MTTEKMTIHEALSELKVIGKRIDKEINDMVEKLLYKSITKACKMGAIRIVSMNTMENYKFLHQYRN